MRYVCMIALLMFSNVALGQYIDMEQFSVELQREKMAAVYSVTTDAGCGTGFAIYQEGSTCYVMTAYHVVDAPATTFGLLRFHVDSRWPKIAKWYDATICAFDETADLAILQFDAGSQRLPTLQIARCLPELPCDGFSIGCAKCEPPTVVSRRLLSGSFSLWHRSRLTEVSTPAIGGDSGGPLFSPVNGHVIGTCVRNNNGHCQFSSLTAMHSLCDRSGLSECYAPSGRLRTETTLFIVIKIVIGIAVVWRGIIA